MARERHLSRVLIAALLAVCGLAASLLGFWYYFMRTDGGWRKEKSVDDIPVVMEGVSLAADVRKDGTSLVLRYVVKNDGPADVGLFVGFFKDRGVGAWLDVQGEELHVRKTDLAPPSSGRPDHWFTPGQTILHPGGRYEEDVVLTQGVKVDNPVEESRRFSPAPPFKQPRPAVPVQVTRAMLHVGAFRIGPRMMVGHADPLAPPGFMITGAGYRDQTVLQTSVVLPEAWTVLDYD